MWIFFGMVAIMSAILNIVWAAKGRESKWFRFISLSFTVLTLCAFYSINAKWAINEDRIALMDTLTIDASRHIITLIE